MPQGIEARDGHPCSIEDLWLTDGASPAVHYMMKALLRDERVRGRPGCAAAAVQMGEGGLTQVWLSCTPCSAPPHPTPTTTPHPTPAAPILPPCQDCILCPIPQYPLYSATIALYGGTLLPYYLEEEAGWQAQQAALKAQVDAARRCGAVGLGWDGLGVEWLFIA